MHVILYVLLFPGRNVISASSYANYMRFAAPDKIRCIPDLLVVPRLGLFSKIYIFFFNGQNAVYLSAVSAARDSLENESHFYIAESQLYNEHVNTKPAIVVIVQYSQFMVLNFIIALLYHI